MKFNYRIERRHTSTVTGVMEGKDEREAFQRLLRERQWNGRDWRVSVGGLSARFDDVDVQKLAGCIGEGAVDNEPEEPTPMKEAQPVSDAIRGVIKHVVEDIFGAGPQPSDAKRLPVLPVSDVKRMFEADEELFKSLDDAHARRNEKFNNLQSPVWPAPGSPAGIAEQERRDAVAEVINKVNQHGDYEMLDALTARRRKERVHDVLPDPNLGVHTGGVRMRTLKQLLQRRNPNCNPDDYYLKEVWDDTYTQVKVCDFMHREGKHVLRLRVTTQEWMYL